jgi:hypothetical protein
VCQAWESRAWKLLARKEWGAAWWGLGKDPWPSQAAALGNSDAIAVDDPLHLRPWIRALCNSASSIVCSFFSLCRLRHSVQKLRTLPFPFLYVCALPPRARQQRQGDVAAGKRPLHAQSGQRPAIHRHCALGPHCSERAPRNAHAINRPEPARLITSTLRSALVPIQLLHVSSTNPVLFRLQIVAATAIARQRWLQRLTASASCPRTRASASSWSACRPGARVTSRREVRRRLLSIFSVRAVAD